MRDERLYLHDISERIKRIEKYTANGFDAFIQTPMIQDAVIRNLGIIGEASKQLSVEFKQEHAEIQWRQTGGLRDVLIHEYLKVNLVRVWQIIEQDLPILKHKVLVILQELNDA